MFLEASPVQAGVPKEDTDAHSDQLQAGPSGFPSLDTAAVLQAAGSSIAAESLMQRGYTT